MSRPSSSKSEAAADAHVTLPPGWTKEYSKSQKKVYYYHHKTNARQWHVPTVMEAQNPQLAAERARRKTLEESAGGNTEGSSNSNSNSNSNSKSNLGASHTYGYHSRKLNNWLKAHLIKTKGKPRGNVLDLACGNGGDISKWNILGVKNYVGVDVARVRLEEAQRRVEGFKGLRFERWSFFKVDLGEEGLEGRVEECRREGGKSVWRWTGGDFRIGFKFDVVSCQLALHYMMQSKEKARNCFKTISDNLREGGTFIITTMDSRYVLERLMGLGGDLMDGKERVIEIGSEGLCSIKVPGETVRRIFSRDEPLTSENWYGLKYEFKLLDTLEPGAGAPPGSNVSVDLEESLLPLELAKSVMEEYGLVLQERLNFSEYFQKHKDDCTDKVDWRNMNVAGVEGNMEQTEWDISRIYCTAAFKKVRGAGGSAAGGVGHISDKDFAIGLMRLRKIHGAEAVNNMSREKKIALIKKL
ncbi:hypothetical protein TrVE_jg7777 [Triparma verrucosa]|uniref:mRNA (guanine-N(7))-methyltransferase n=1 Tax=Triparma verrucosa TaxID=1606542 RepID=A0A9W7BR41_9STRA|nr:hypothetical protein TrVE_jg7777 [Triparma verrucosa]